jgi:hypothetical protein
MSPYRLQRGVRPRMSQVLTMNADAARTLCFRSLSTVAKSENGTFLTPGQATKVMYKLTRFSKVNEDSIQQLDIAIRSIVHSVASLNPQALSRVVWCMISLNVDPQIILSLPLQDAIRHMDPPSITRFTHKLHHVVPGANLSIWESVLGTVMARIDEMTPVEVVTCCCSFAKAGFKTPTLYHHITSRLIPDESSLGPHWDIATWEPRQVALLIWCLNTSECTNWNLIKFLLDRLPHLTLSSKDVACILSGLSRSNFIHEDQTIAKIPIRQIFTVSTPSIQTLCTTLHSIARLASLDDRLLVSHRARGDVLPSDFWLTRDLVAFLTDEILNHAPLSLRAMAMLTWSLMKLRIRYSPVFDLVSNHFVIPEKLSTESKADIVTIISSISAMTTNTQLAEIAHSLLASSDWTTEESSTLIHLLWSIGLMEGQSSPISEHELRTLSRLIATTTERTDASMLFHYTLLRGIDIRFPFGSTSWKLTNMQWVQEESNVSTIESTVSGWLKNIPSIRSVETSFEILPGIYTDILVNGEVAVEINGPSHYSFDLITGEMFLDTKSLRRNEIIAKKLKKVVDISFADFSDLLAMTESERDNTLVNLISL